MKNRLQTVEGGNIHLTTAPSVLFHKKADPAQRGFFCQYFLEYAQVMQAVAGSLYGNTFQIIGLNTAEKHLSPLIQQV